MYKDPGFGFRTYTFLIHVNDMLSICRLFADDNSLQQSSYDMFDNLIMIYKVRNMVKQVVVSKTKVVYFSRKVSLITPTLFFQGDKPECVPVHRHLGLLLSHNIFCSEYIFSKVEKNL